MDAFANTHIRKKVGEFLWLTSEMSPSPTGKCKIAYLLARRKRPPVGQLEAMSWFTFSVFIITLFCPEASIHLLKKECWQNSKGQVRQWPIKKEETRYPQLSTPNRENRNATWVCLYPFKCCELLASVSSPLSGPQFAFLCMFSPGTVEG